MSEGRGEEARSCLNTVALCDILVATVIEIVAQAEISSEYASRMVDRIAESATEVSRGVANLKRSTPADSRAATYRARRARLSAQRVANQAAKVSEAAIAAREATHEICEYVSASSPSMGNLQEAIDGAIKATIRADRAARLARLHLWEGANAALETAQIRDIIDLVVSPK